MGIQITRRRFSSTNSLIDVAFVDFKLFNSKVRKHFEDSTFIVGSHLKTSPYSVFGSVLPKTSIMSTVSSPAGDPTQAPDKDLFEAPRRPLTCNFPIRYLIIGLVALGCFTTCMSDAIMNSTVVAMAPQRESENSNGSKPTAQQVPRIL